MEEVNYQITITEEAATEIKSQLEQRGKSTGCLRLGIRGSGCSGFSYVLRYEDQSKEKDLTFQAHGVTVVVDRKSILFLNGCTLSWESSLMRQGFVLLNPNEKSKCGCGHSFSV